MPDASSLHVELVIPEDLLFSEAADSCVIPGIEGEIGVLPNHAPVLTQLRPGIVSIARGEDALDIFVGGGFAEVTPERCTILASEAMPASEITKEMARERMALATTMLTEAQTEEEHHNAQFALAEAEAMAIAARQ